MDIPSKPEQPATETAEQVSELFEALDATNIVETQEFKQLLDHIPIAIVISKSVNGKQRICYANKAFEALTGLSLSDLAGRGWSILAGYVHETEQMTLADAVLQVDEEFLGSFRAQEPRPLLVEAYAGLIENEDGTENYRIAALIDVTDRDRADREQFSSQIRGKDMLLKELQHRVRNNLQLIVALIRLEARNERRGEKVNWATLAGRIESLQLLYDALAPESLGGEVELGHYISQIAAAVMNTYAVDGIRLEQRVEHSPVSINIALPIGLLVNELLTNAFKHAFVSRGHGLITVECLHQGDERYRVLVADDGAGLAPDSVWPVPGKIGALIVQTLRENTKADVKVESAPQKGLRVSITFDRKVSPPKPN
jgi:PAS domain S-box-containing protein